MEEMELHKIEVHKDGIWEETEYHTIQIGDRFRMFHPDGTPFIDSDNQHVLHAASEPFFDEELGVWLVYIK